MKLSIFRRLLMRGGMALSLLAAAAATVSCEKIYDSEGDCRITYEVAFTHTMNILGTDAFATRVNSVSLFVFDSNGRCVLTKTEDGPALEAKKNGGRYTMLLTSDDIAPGTYDLIAWCGLTANQAFSLACGNDGQPAAKEDLVCRLEARDEGVCNSRLDHLFHGMAEGVEFPEVYGRNVVTANIDLTKNTNTIRIVLQHYNGRPLDMNDFHFSVADNNGKMNYDNSLMTDDDPILYSECVKREGVVERPQGRADDGWNIDNISSVVAEIDMARLVEAQRPMLTVDVDGKDVPVLHMPLIDLLLVAKGEANRSLSNQDYLDCQDDFTLFFYLDDAYGWYTQGGIWVNSWHVVFSDKDL